MSFSAALHCIALYGIPIEALEIDSVNNYQSIFNFKVRFSFHVIRTICEFKLLGDGNSLSPWSMEYIMSELCLSLPL